MMRGWQRCRDMNDVNDEDTMDNMLEEEITIHRSWVFRFPLTLWNQVKLSLGSVIILAECPGSK